MFSHFYIDSLFPTPSLFLLPIHPPFSTALLLTCSCRLTKDEMQRELLENMYRTDTLDDLLKESDFTVRRRKECQQMVESLGKASEIVSQVQ